MNGWIYFIVCILSCMAGFWGASVGLHEFYRKQYEAKLANLLKEMVVIWNRLEQEKEKKAKQFRQGLN